MDEWKGESPDDLSQTVVEEAKRPLDAWLEAWTWAKRVVGAEVEVPCATPRVEVWTRAWEMADAIVGAETPREWETLGWRWHREVNWWEARRGKAGLHSWMAQAEVEALALVGVLGWVRSEAWARGERVPSALAHSSIITDILCDLNCYGVGHHLWHHSRQTRDEYSCILLFITPITRLPFELLRQIFLIVIDGASALPLLLACKQWHAIGTSIWGSLDLGTMTPLDVVTRTLGRSQWLLDIRVDTDSDRNLFDPWARGDAFGALFAAIEASSRWRSFVIESFPAKADLPKDLVNRRLRRCSDGTMNRFTVFKIKSACEKSPLLDGLLHILGTTSRMLITVEINSANVVSFLAPAYPSMFHSIKVLSLDTPGIPNPVDLLPHLHQLETFTASHISFPICNNDVDLPFIHTLRHLSLRAASIHWMNGRTFPILEDCTLVFPLHHHVLYTLRTNLPNCMNLTFQGYPLEILGGVLAHKLTYLSVTSSGSFNRRGSRQLAWLSRHVLEQTQLTPKILHITIEATNQAWVNALGFMSNLEELVISNARPCSLGAKALQSLIVHPIIPSAISIPGESGAPLCPLLQRFVLQYHRWLRPSEEFHLIPVFVSIIESRQHSSCPLESFSLQVKMSGKIGRLELIEGSKMSVKAVGRFDWLVKKRWEFR